MTKHPFRNFEHSCMGDVCDESNPLPPYNLVFSDFFNKIMNLYCTRFEWEGLPSEMSSFLIEEILFKQGRAVMIYDNVVQKFGVMTVGLSGKPDIYNIPEDRWAFAPNGYIKQYGKENSVILWDNPTCYAYINTASLYAKTLANAWLTKEINMFSQRTPVALACTDEQKLTYQIIGEQYSNYLPVIKVNDSINLDKIKAIKLDAPYIVDKCEEEIRRVFSQVLTDLGFESNPVEKRERLVTGETQGNNGEIEGMRNVGLSQRKRFCDSINKLWGLNVSVKFRSDLPTFVNGFIPKDIVNGEEGGEHVE